MFFAVKHIYLTLYIVYALRISPIYSVPAKSSARARVAVRPPARSLPADRRTCSSARARVWPRVCVWPRGRACVWPRVCVGARVAALASVVRAYIVASPAVLPRAGLAANFFEIVFKPSISVQLSFA